MDYITARHGTKLPQAKAEPRPAAEVTALLASVALAGVRIAPSMSGHTLTLRGRTEKCADLRAVRNVLLRWGGQA